jgi:hypothetical protein
MALWGTEDTLEGKPKIFGRSLLATGITNDPRAKVYATTAGWVYPPVKAGGTPETLVAIRGLSTRTGTATGFAAAGLAAASITSVNWNDMTYSRAEGDTVSVSVNFNETVTVSAGNPTLLVTNVTSSSRNITLGGAGQWSGSGTNRLTFTKVIGTNNAAWTVGDVLSIAAQSIAGGATIHDTVAGAGTAAVVAISTGIGDAAGDVTVVT